MSTLEELKRTNLLRTWSLGGDALCERTIYYTRGWSVTVHSLSQAITPGQRKNLPMRAQVKGLCDAFCRGENMGQLEVAGMYPPFEAMWNPCRPAWEMKTSDTRTFGWFAAPGVFVAVLCHRTEDLKVNGQPDLDAYRKAGQAVLDWRQRHGIDQAETCVLKQITAVIPPCSTN